MANTRLATRLLKALLAPTRCPHGEHSSLECEGCFRDSYLAPTWPEDHRPFRDSVRVKSPYGRPFEHCAGCGCIDCDIRRARSLKRWVVALLAAVGGAVWWLL